MIRAILIACAVLFAQQCAAQVRHWKLDESAGDATASDSAASNDLSLTSGTTADIAVGAGNGPGGLAANAGFDFPGDRSAETVDSQAGMGLANACSVSLALRCDDAANATGKQVVWEAGGATHGTCLYVYDGRLYFSRAISNTSYYASVPITNGSWRHVLAYYNTTGTKVGLILDGGVSDETVDASLSATNAGFGGGAIGGVDTSTRFHDGTDSAAGLDFNGAIAWVKVWDSDESANAATEAAEVGLGGKSMAVIMRYYIGARR